MHTIGTWWMWVGFLLFVLVVLAIDTFFLGDKKSHRVSTREAFTWVVVWFACAMLFMVFLWWYLLSHSGAVIAQQKALEFFTGYLLEKSLSVDNLFVFIMIFHYFSVPVQYQKRVLLYGIAGAVILRFVMILLGTWAVSQIHWILYFFGVFLIMTGIKMLFMSDEKKDFAKNPLLLFLRKHLRMTHEFHGEKFFVRRNLIWYATPLFLVVVLIELGDLIFALDSIPAIFAVTLDPFIVFTSNIFAILGLRSLYFLLSNMADRFYMLKYGIALMLVFIGAKMLLADVVNIPILLALGILVAILGTTIILNLLFEKR